MFVTVSYTHLSFDVAIDTGNLNPFAANKIVICSFQFAKAKAAYIKHVAWDLVIIDEAHRLRNVYKPTNKIANAIKLAIESRKKILLTATPLQNSILELYGLCLLYTSLWIFVLCWLPTRENRDSLHVDAIRDATSSIECVAVPSLTM